MRGRLADGSARLDVPGYENSSDDSSTRLVVEVCEPQQAAGDVRSPSTPSRPPSAYPPPSLSFFRLSRQHRHRATLRAHRQPRWPTTQIERPPVLRPWMHTKLVAGFAIHPRMDLCTCAHPRSPSSSTSRASATNTSPCMALWEERTLFPTVQTRQHSHWLPRCPRQLVESPGAVPFALTPAVALTLAHALALVLACPCPRPEVSDILA